MTNKYTEELLTRLVRLSWDKEEGDYKAFIRINNDARDLLDEIVEELECCGADLTFMAEGEDDE